MAQRRRTAAYSRPSAAVDQLHDVAAALLRGIAAATDLADVVALAGRALGELLARQDDRRPLSVRVTITGRSAAHGDLFGQYRQLREELLAQAAALGADRLWIEKVRVETLPPADERQLRERSDAIADLQALLQEVAQDEAFLRSLTDDLRQLTGKAPAELAEAVPDFEAIRAGDVAALVRSVTPGLLARLAQTP